MSKFVGYYARAKGFGGNLSGLPSWARMIFVAITLPGIVLVGLSIVAVMVSIAALLILAIPVYMLLRALTGSPVQSVGTVVYDADANRTQVRRVEARVLEPGNQAPDEVNGE